MSTGIGDDTLGPSIQPFATASPTALREVRFVLTDMDDTLTYEGKLSAQTYDGLERLQSAGIKVIPVTAASAGWCDQMVRMWPIDAVVGENGGFYSYVRDGDVERRYWLADDAFAEGAERLRVLHGSVDLSIEGAKLASDQPFRLTTIAWQRTQDARLIGELQGAFRVHRADSTINSLWVLAWFGGFDKLQMARRMMRELYDVDVDHEREAVVYVSDSENDAPMFRHFPMSVGVSTVRDHIQILSAPPRWITEGAGGVGFVEVADAILATRS